MSSKEKATALDAVWVALGDPEVMKLIRQKAKSRQNAAVRAEVDKLDRGMMIEALTDEHKPATGPERRIAPGLFKWAGV